jgi:iron(III) transport system substrate-binding protein
MRKPFLLAAGLTVLAATAGCGVFAGDPEPADLQVYSARHYGAEEVFARFEEDTGISVDFLDGDDAELLQRIKAEGEDSPADVYITVDAGNLWSAADQGVLAEVNGPELTQAIPARYRDSGNRWFGLVLRARTVIYNPDNVDPAEFDPVDTYGGLADPKWKGRLCMRGTTGVYTASLVASLIDLHGRDKALEMVEGWVANDVQVESNDVLLIDAVDAGTCDVALVNHYYLARELVDRPDLDVELYWASQEGAGTHVNISGAGLVASSDNPDDAAKLLSWLATDGQDDLVKGNQEYAVNPKARSEEIAASFGRFEPMEIDAEAYGSRNADAIDLLAEAGYE